MTTKTIFSERLGNGQRTGVPPQAVAYLYRDDPNAVIRAFYSRMACAFSHTVFEAVEHRCDARSILRSPECQCFMIRGVEYLSTHLYVAALGETKFFTSARSRSTTPVRE
jgi:hypothetical protein